MGLYTSVASGLLFPVHEVMKKHNSVALRRELEESQWLSADEMAALRVKRLREFLVDIGEHVSYFRDHFQRLGFNPAEVSSLADLTALPLLDKAAIRDNTEALTADDAGPLTRSNTGGSSGEPLVFYMGPGRVSHDVASKWRATRWWDVDIGDPEIVIWGSPIELGSQDYVRMVRDKLLRTRLLSAFEMSSANLDNFVDTIIRVKPKMLFGYPSALCTIAAHAEKRSLSMRELGIKVAFTTSERLYDYQREAIEQAFNCPVANGYGGRDAGFIAHQCPAGGMHITAEDLIVEILDEEGRPVAPGESGEIVTTHLGTRDFPFVRYRTGDVGALSDEQCSCGRGLPLMKEIDGRSTDFMVAADGTVIHGLAFIYVLRDMPGVSQFKITQHDLQRVTLELIKNERYGSEDEEEIVRVFKQRLGQSVDIDVEYTDFIAAEKSGKYRYIISHVKP